MARVRITRHARERAEERLPDIKISPGRLNQQIYGGLELVNRHDGTILSVGCGWCAICARRPGVAGVSRLKRGVPRVSSDDGALA